jgi:hypothetical protein
MKVILHSVLVATCMAILPTVAPAQTRKPVTKPTVKAAAKPAAKPVAKPAPTSPTRATAPAPTPAPAPIRSSAATSSPSSSPFDVGTNVVNLGIGLGSRYGYGYSYLSNGSSVSPAISLSYERGILQLGPGVLGVGLFAGYQGASYEYSGYKDKFTDIVVMVRGAFHYPVNDKFDAYGGVGIGVRHLGYSSSYVGPYAFDYGVTGATSGLFVGGRYYFSQGIGAFAELGYDQSYLKIGLSAKF